MYNNRKSKFLKSLEHNKNESKIASQPEQEAGGKE
jgi:hypothetical protein